MTGSDAGVSAIRKPVTFGQGLKSGAGGGIQNWAGGFSSPSLEESFP
jgi:hypothetical protein